MFFNLIENDARRFSAYNNYYYRNTGRSFKPIFMKFKWFGEGPHMDEP